MDRSAELKNAQKVRVSEELLVGDPIGFVNGDFGGSAGMAAGRASGDTAMHEEDYQYYWGGGDSRLCGSNDDRSGCGRQLSD